MKTQTKTSLFNRVLPVIAVLLGLAAVISLIARWLIYDIEHYREMIVSQISETFKLDASIGEINARIDFINPIIYAEQVQLSSPDTSDLPLTIGRMEIVIDLFASLLQTRPRFQSIRLADTELAISTDFQNRLLRLPQINRQWNIPDTQFNLAQLIGKAVAINYFDLGLHDTLIHWDDESSTPPRTFRIENFTLSPGYRQTRIALDTELPRTFGRRLVLIAELDHDLRNPNGDFYIKTEDLNLADVSRLAGAEGPHSGLIQAELWGHASYLQGLEDLTGALALKDYLNPALNSDNAIAELKTKLNWQARAHSRELGLSKLSMQRGEATIKNADLAIIQTQNENRYSGNLRFSADYISPSVYSQLLAYAQTGLSLEQSHSEIAHTKQPIDLILRTDHSADWFVSPHDWPPIQALESTMLTDLPQPTSGQLEMTLNDVRFNRQQWSTPQNLAHIELKGTYKNRAGNREWNLEHLHIKGSDSNLYGDLRYRITDEKQKHLRSSLQLHHLEATEIIRWIPPRTLNPKLGNWLRDALRSGTIVHAELSADGNPDLAFKENGGHWSLQAQAEDLNLAYRNKDPEIKDLNLDLSLENQTLKIRSKHLRIMDFYSEDTSVELEDITIPYVKISSRGRGPLADILSYVKNTGLVNPKSIVIANIAADGDVNMNLEVHTRLSPTVERETYVGGYIDLDGTDLKLKALDLDLKQLEGRLHFNRQGGRSDELKALLNGSHPLTATAEAQAGATLLKVETRIPFPSDYLQTLSLPQNTFSKASDTWYAELLIPPLQPDSEATLELKLHSNLEALAVNLPHPLYKLSGNAADSTVYVKITDYYSNYRFDYGDRLRLTLRIPNTEDATETAKGLLHFSPTIAYPYEADAETRFMVRGVIPYLSVNEWQDWLEHYQNAAVQPVTYAQDVDVLLEELVWNTSTLNQVHLKMKQQADKTLMTFDSDAIKGNASIPADRTNRVYIDLEHLILEGGALWSDTHNLDPNTLPPTAIKIDRFKNDYYDIEELKIALSPRDGGTRIAKMSFRKKSDDEILIQAQLEGDWTRIANRDRSSFKFTLNSDDYGQLLRNWNFYSGLKGGQGTISGQLLWDNSPLDFEIDRLQGPIKLQIKDGAIQTIEPGVGRLFGLLNINALARRLKFDFKDVFDRGFEFDDMQGILEFDKADLITRNLDVNGSTLDMKITGRTGITRRDYDQKIIVIPHVGTNVAVATAFLGGPLTAAAVFLLSQVTQLDNWIDKVITLEYTLKGSWDKPEVQFTSAPVAQKLNPADTIKNSSKHVKSILDKIFPSTADDPETNTP